MIIREATSKDAYAIAKVHVASWQSTYRGLVPQHALDSLSVERRAQRWEQLVVSEVTKTFVLIDDSTIVGFVNCGPARDEDQDPITIGEIPALYLLKSKQQRGYGTLLFEKACEYLLERNHVYLTLWVLEGNTQAIGFYEAMGLSPDGTRKETDKGDYKMYELRYRRVL